MKKEYIILVGKSGSGKSEITKYLKEDFGLIEAKTNTTRTPRFEGEDTHTFTNLNQYELDRRLGNIIADTYFCGNIYWTTKSQINESDIAIFDVLGVKKFNKIYDGDKEAVVFYIKTSLLDRVKFMQKRGDTAGQIIKRVMHDAFAFKGVKEVSDMTIYNSRNVKPKFLANKIVYDTKMIKTIRGFSKEYEEF